MASYFSYFPEIAYVSRTPDRTSSNEYIVVKNLFRRAKIRDDFFNVVTAFEDYMIIGDERPDQVAEAIYGDPRFDWVILVTNHITNIRDQWPLNHFDFQNYLLEKYESEENYTKIHHYITEMALDSRKRVVVPEGLRFDSNFNSQFIDQNIGVEVNYGGGTLNELSTVDESGTVKDASGNVVTHDNILAVTNYEYEEDLNDSKRRIRILKEDYLNVVISDLRRIMKYKKSSQYISRGLKQAYNPRLSGA